MAKKESYIKSSYDELINKVSWPSWSDLQSSSIVVAIASAIIASMDRSSETDSKSDNSSKKDEACDSKHKASSGGVGEFLANARKKSHN